MATINYRDPRSKQFLCVDFPIPYIEANPNKTSEIALDRIEINGQIYNIVSSGSGNAVIANTDSTIYDEKLTTINIEGVNYYVQDLNIQRIELPEAKLSEVGNIYQYMGETINDIVNRIFLKHGYFYTCVADEEANEFVWQLVQTSIIDSIEAEKVTYDNTTSQSEATTAQAAIDDLYGRVVGNPQELGTENLKELKVGATTYTIPDRGDQIYVGETEPSGELANTVLIWINLSEDY